jgi:signal transduction histidine kinase
MSLPDTLHDRASVLALVAHELRDPLGTALESLHILRLLCSDGRIRDQVCDRIERQLRHASALLDDLLELSRADLGKLSVRRDRLDLACLARTVIDDHRDAMLSAGLSVAPKVPARPLWVIGDELRLRQVLNNLLDNARKFTLRGGQITVTASANESARQACLLVRDNGQGIEADLIDTIFDPFVQTERIGDRVNAGLGLGLALVKRLVEMHEGSVEAFSDGPGQGAEFLVRLPLHESCSPAAKR